MQCAICVCVYVWVCWQCFVPGDSQRSLQWQDSSSNSALYSNRGRFPTNTVSGDEFRMTYVPENQWLCATLLANLHVFLACSSVYQGKLDAACHLVVVLRDSRHSLFGRDCSSESSTKVVLSGNTAWQASSGAGALGEATGAMKSLVLWQTDLICS